MTAKAQRNAHGRYWTYTVQLRGRSDPVTVFCGPKPNDWAFRSVRPIEYIQPDANVVAVKPSLPVQVIPLVQQPSSAANLVG